MKAVLDRFVDAIDAEIAVLEEDGRDRTFELRSGERVSPSGEPGGVYVFLLPDALRLPEDSTGMVSVGETQAPCIVTAQEGNRLWILIESAEQLSPVIPSARLVLAQTDLLKRLKETLLDLDSFGLAPKVFGLESGRVGWVEMPQQLDVGGSEASSQLALEQALGSEVTFIWGPPGTGKTFSIARLVAAAVLNGESVLVTSHTHAAVEQALWATVEPKTESRDGGPLHDSPLIDSGALLKIGPLRQQKIPRSCHLDSRLEDLDAKNRVEIAELTLELTDIDAELARVTNDLGRWRKLADFEAGAADLKSKEAELARQLNSETSTFESARREAGDRREALAKAEASFFIGRQRRVESARTGLRSGHRDLEAAEGRVNESRIALGIAQQETAEVVEDIRSSNELIRGLRPMSVLEAEAASLEATRGRLQQRVEQLRPDLDEAANELLDSAQALFATLTKLYIDRRLNDREWDVIVVDEVSMAMPPLVAFAASRAAKRVILVGDFYQLPPIVQSREGVAHEELGVDIFERRGIPEAVEAGDDHPQLAKLISQRRMAPEIADVARALAYGEHLKDHPTAALRQSPAWVEVAGESAPLIVLDLERLHAWAGKLPGTLSRFNFYSGLGSVELAAQYASRLPEPAASAAPPIGIVTPYSAQRRYVSRLVRELGLERWVASGTVHTFQGNESDVIIFDSVLAEPHWTARLTNPHEFHSVRRDLNVAVTRARHQFVFVGDSQWLDKHAKEGSAFGVLWAHLRRHARILDAGDVLGGGLRHRVSDAVADALGWNADTNPGTSTLLDESSFYPHFSADIQRAKSRVVMFTPYIGKTRWPQIEPFITDAAARGVEIFLLHRPLDDRVWQEGDPSFGRSVFNSLRGAGVRLIPFSGIHAKTIVIDGEIVYEGSLNWASHVNTYEHMWRFESSQLAAVVERMLQLRDVVKVFAGDEPHAMVCPNCGGFLYALNQRDKGANWAKQAIALACSNYARDKSLCSGYIRRIDQRAPFIALPTCDRGSEMWLYYTKTKGHPWDWRCEHKSCKKIRWIQGDPTPK